MPFQFLLYADDIKLYKVIKNIVDRYLVQLDMNSLLI